MISCVVNCRGGDWWRHTAALQTTCQSSAEPAHRTSAQNVHACLVDMFKFGGEGEWRGISKSPSIYKKKREEALNLLLANLLTIENSHLFIWIIRMETSLAVFYLFSLLGQSQV